MRNIINIFNALVFRNRPVYIHYGITHRCNLRCRMCKIYRDAKEDEELSMDKIEKTFDVLRKIGVVYVSIGGGEPLLKKDLPLIIKLLIKKGFIVRLLTNGTLIDEDLVKRLISAGLRDVSISLDTLDSGRQDYIYNYNGAFDKVMRSMDLFSTLVPRNRRLLLINTVVSPLNIRELPELSQFARQKGYYISFIPIENNGLPEFTFRQEDHHLIDESYNYLIKMKKENRNNIFNSPLFLIQSQQYLKFNGHNWRCDAGRLYFSLNPKGELSICHRFKPEISLLETEFKRYTKKKEFIDRREKLIRECPSCIRPCWAELSFLMKNKRYLWNLAKVGFSYWQTFVFKL